MTATKTQTKQREEARKAVHKRKEVVDAETRLRDKAETEVAVDFRLASAERDAALQAVAAAEVEMGAAVDQLIGKLRISYARAAELLELSADELRRLRGLAVAAADTDAASPERGVASPPEESAGPSTQNAQTEASAA